jgi:hypothetical protein
MTTSWLKSFHLRLAAVLGTALTVLAVSSAPALASTFQGDVWRQEGTIDQPSLTAQTVVNRSDGVSTQARLYTAVDKDHQAAHVVVTSGSRGVRVQAQCARRNGGTEWYESTIVVHAGEGDSHFDCDNNGTYNFKLVGLGVQFVE